MARARLRLTSSKTAQIVPRSARLPTANTRNSQIASGRRCPWGDVAHQTVAPQRPSRLSQTTSTAPLKGSARRKSLARPTIATYTRRSRTPGISCERPIRSTLVCFIPLFDGLVARRDEPFDARATAPDCCDTPCASSPTRAGAHRVLLLLECRNSERARSWRVHNAPTLVERRQPATYEDDAPPATAMPAPKRLASAHGLGRSGRLASAWLARQIAVAPAVAHSSPRRSRDTGSVRRTLGISCEAPLCSGFVSFIPLLGRPLLQ